VHSIEEILSGNAPELRLRALQAVDEIIDKIASEEKLNSPVRNFQDHFDAKSLEKLREGLIRKARTELFAAASTDDSFIYELVDEAFETIFVKLTTDSNLQQKINLWIADTIEGILNEHRPTIEDLLAETIKRWDEKDFTDKIESYVYNDLQYIRINGAVVGGLVGLGIHLSEFLFAG
jgi:uncharacterized membrane-anchored protein YjiN (DUF445 family)